ncbi:(2Fe-2S) ferredoxin domain-containing protein [Pseudalkalibacillus decolorationis]|uniref:(2Fe-2S) ferredoxin domain-containing protein n=1 Tax=Pseudalkalibacillus decolorationis TaxID=163879 RepID=UPI002147E056|nr:(2Fe-2S) ferredoxin domain-containing protein [Pseudalkalibacillus decolorationis]
MELNGVNQHVMLCNGKSCTKNGADEVTEAIRNEIKSLGLAQKIHTTKTLCNGQCKRGPTVIAYPEGVWYKHMTADSGRQLVQRLQKEEQLDEHISYTHNGTSFHPYNDQGE